MSAAGRVILAVGGMTCQGCVRALTGALAALDGARVTSVTVGEARLELSPDVPDARLREVVEDAGFTLDGVSRSPA